MIDPRVNLPALTAAPGRVTVAGTVPLGARAELCLIAGVAFAVESSEAAGKKCADQDLSSVEPTQWHWLVTPLAKDTLTDTLRVSAKIFYAASGARNEFDTSFAIRISVQKEKESIVVKGERGIKQLAEIVAAVGSLIAAAITAVTWLRNRRRKKTSAAGE